MGFYKVVFDLSEIKSVVNITWRDFPILFRNITVTMHSQTSNVDFEITVCFKNVSLHDGLIDEL